MPATVWLRPHVAWRSEAQASHDHKKTVGRTILYTVFVRPEAIFLALPTQSHIPFFAFEANTAPFCSIAQTVAHLLILRLTFYIPTHSSLFFAFLIGYFVSRCGSGWPGAKTLDKTLSLHTSRPPCGARGVYPRPRSRVFSLSSFLCSLKNCCVPYRAV